jgi:copper(I)-binding protein
LTIENARVRAPAGGQTITAGFLTVRGGAQADRLLAASSPNAESIEIHTVREEGGMMQMIKVDALEVPAGGALDLQPGGNHLMLFGYVAPADGAATPVTLTFEKAGAVDAMLALDTTAAPGGHGGGH